jgi:capsular polysaccharide biosynthesis protein
MRNIKQAVKKLYNYINHKKITGVSIHSNSEDLSLVPFSEAEQFSMEEKTDIFGGKHRNFFAYESTIPEYYAVVVKNGKCRVGYEEAYTNDDRVLLEITSQRDNPALNSSIERKERAIRLKGSVANLSLSGLENNYYHFLVEFAARIHILRKLDINPDYYIYPLKTAFQREFLDYFEIERSKVVSLEEGTKIQADRLVVPALINNWNPVMFRGCLHYQKQYLPRWLPDVYGNFKASTKGKKYVYISREHAGYRKVLNEHLIVDNLRHRNFEIHSPEKYSIEKQAALFKDCSVLIAPHGSGLANMCFCAPGVSILEIFPYHSHCQSMAIQAKVLGHKYDYVIGDSIDVTGKTPQHEDIAIDINTFNRAVDLFLARQ